MELTPMERVAIWHERFLVPMPTEPDLSPDACKLRIRLLMEEKDELFQAIADQDRKEQLDALCDLQYVLSGAVLMLGLRRCYANYAAARVAFAVNDNSSTLTRAAMLSMKIKYLEHVMAGAIVSTTVANLHGCQLILSGLIKALGFAEVFSEAFRAVDENNTEKTWSEENARMDNWPDLTFIPCVWKEGYCIGKDAGGKIVKPPGHRKVDLSRFIV